MKHPKLDFSALDEAAQAEVDGGLSGCQLAVAVGGEVVFTGSYGLARPSTRFWIASATKPIVSSAILILMAEGVVDIERPVADYIPEFAENGKQNVTVEQVMLMTSGFPDAEITPEEGGDPVKRRAAFARWTLESPPGAAYAYHGCTAHWVLADLIERVTGEDFRDFVETRITAPLGLPRVLGIALEDQGDVAQLSPHASLEVRELQDYASKIEVGEPGGGALMTASDLALFYQGLLHDPAGIWDEAILADGLGHVRCTLPDPLLGMPANRTLAVVIGNGFGSTWGRSGTAFGWPGYGGQIGFAEPAVGLSFAFLQVGDVEQLPPFVRGIRFTNMALDLADSLA